MRIDGAGMPVMGSAGEFGDLLISLTFQLPDLIFKHKTLNFAYENMVSVKAPEQELPQPKCSNSANF